MSVPKQDDFAHRDEAGKVSALLTPLPWAQHLIILSQSKRLEERLFCINMAARERWIRREMDRRLKATLFERGAVDTLIASPLVTQSKRVL
jgi:hypothetical protein